MPEVSIPRAVRKAIEDSTDAQNIDVSACLRSLLEQGFHVVRTAHIAGRDDGPVA